MGKVTKIEIHNVRNYLDLDHGEMELFYDPNPDRDWTNRWVLTAEDGWGENCAWIDLVELIEWLRANKPEFLIPPGADDPPA